MVEATHRLAYVTSHPIQYQAPLFRAMGRSSRIELKVFYCSDHGQEKYDPGFGRRVDFGVPLKRGFTSQSLWNAGELLSGRFSLMNPGLPFALKAFEPHATVVHGYYHASMLTALLTASRFSSVFLRGESSFLGDAYRPRPRINRFILQGLLRSIDGVAAIGTANAQFYESLGVPNNRIFMTPYSVDNDYFRDRVSPESAARTRASLSIPPDAIVLGFVGKLSDVKGCRELLAAFERVKATLPGVHLVFVGEGPHGDEIRKRTRSCNRTHVVGFQPQAALATWYQMFDVFILPSLFEPWGLVVNEAMNFAVPVVVSDRVGAAYDLVEGYQCGWIFRADDAGSLDAVLRECTSLSSTELSRRGRSALQRVSQWGIAETVSGFESLVDFA